LRILILTCALALLCTTAFSATLVDIPLDQQINIGLGDAIWDHSSFGTDPGGGYVRLDLTSGEGAGGWYFAPHVDLVKAGYGPYVDMSGSDITIQYTARYFQGGGNTNPYGDCNIMVQLFDVNGRSRGLGTSYGPRPNPTYPAWITCTDNMTADWPNNADFDPSKVTSVTFFGTDWAGVGNDFVEIRNFRILNSQARNPEPIGAAKTHTEGSPTEIEGIVTAAMPGLGGFYVEDPLRIAGIQVRGSSLPAVGASVYVQGTVAIDHNTSEMYINSTHWSLNGSPSAVAPLCLTSRALGGGPLGEQAGVENGTGLNNIGLLARLSGTVTACAEDFSWAYVSDGYDTVDGAQYSGVKVDLSEMARWQRPTITEGQSVIVTGISSVYNDSDAHLRMIRARSASDFASAVNPGNEPKTVRVAVINFDPYCPGYGNQLTHVACGFNEPHGLVEGYVQDLLDCSGSFARFDVVSWFDARYFPYFEDGYVYSADEFVYAWKHRGTVTFHSGTSDYVRLVTDSTYPHNQPTTIAERIANDEIDEVFFIGPPYAFAGWEAAMAGPSPFFVNGGTYLVPESGRNFVMMGFNYERGVDCMLEDFCHRTECTMSRVYPSPNWWLPTYPPIHNWDRFRMYDQRGPGHAACGICHFAPNSTSDYDWGNTNYVLSTCDDWLYNWPNLLGDITQRLVNRTEWGNGDMRLHHLWWLNHLPKAPGVNPDSRQNNWWKYVCDFNSYPESR